MEDQKLVSNETTKLNQEDLLVKEEKLEPSNIKQRITSRTEKISEFERIFSIIEEAFPKDKAIRTYALPQAIQWLGPRFFTIWVFPILLINRVRRFIKTINIVQPYEDSLVDSYLAEHTETVYTATKDVFAGNGKMRFFGGRFLAIWVLPMAITGVVMEFLFVGPLMGVNPFN